MGNTATEQAAGKRINALLDAGGFVEIGGAVTARNTDFNLQEQKTPALTERHHRLRSDRRQPGSYVYSQDASVLGGAVGENAREKDHPHL